MDDPTIETSDGERCQRCGEIGQDRRTLWMACLYEMDELGLPFEQRVLFHAALETLTEARAAGKIEIGGRSINVVPGTVTSSGELTPQSMYTLRVCKSCRSDWLGAIRAWFNDAPLRSDTGTGVFVRDHGASRELGDDEVDE